MEMFDFTFTDCMLYFKKHCLYMIKIQFHKQWENNFVHTIAGRYKFKTTSRKYSSIIKKIGVD